jgi:hypothetical protein
MNWTLPIFCIPCAWGFINIGRVKEKENCIYMGLVKRNG